TGGDPRPPVSPGDTLNLDLSGAGTISLSSSLKADGYQGVWSLGNLQSVSFSQIETLGGTTDLSVSLSGPATVGPGSTLTYTINVTNKGPLAVTGASITDTLPAGLVGAIWTAFASAGSSVTASGMGNVNASANLLPGGTATFQVSGTLSPSASGPLA